MIGEKCGVGGHDFMSNRDLLDVKVNHPLSRHIAVSQNGCLSNLSTVHVWINGLGKTEGFPMVARHGGLLPRFPG